MGKLRHIAMAVRPVAGLRSAFRLHPDLGDRTQIRATVGLYYTLLGHDRFGATEWR